MSRKKENWQDRKDRLARERMEREVARNKMGAAVVVAAIIVVVGAAAYYIATNSGGGGGGGEYVPATATNSQTGADVVTIPVSEVGTDAKFYTYDSSGTDVRFFATRGPDGNIHVATDACDVCYQNHKGYRQSGTSMQCNNCGKTFGINNIGTKNTAGGCWPSYLPMKTDGSNVLVKKSDLDGKAYMFR
jgi:uncharacterized membrane protein